MASRTLTPIGQLITLLDNLPLLVRETRRARHLNLTQAAEQAGIDKTTLHRIERGNVGYRMENVRRLLRWIDQPATLAGEINGEVQPGIPGLHGEPGVAGDAGVEAPRSRLEV
jgi:transcriptional regulator with XRE-family HTH domain